MQVDKVSVSQESVHLGAWNPSKRQYWRVVCHVILPISQHYSFSPFSFYISERDHCIYNFNKYAEIAVQSILTFYNDARLQICYVMHCLARLSLRTILRRQYTDEVTVHVHVYYCPPIRQALFHSRVSRE